MQQRAVVPTIEQLVVRERVLGEYLPAWCAASWQRQTFDPAAFRPDQDWSFLTPGLAHWFLIAIDEGVVEVSEGTFSRGAWSTGIFERHGPKGVSPRPTRLRQESFFEIAAAGMLAVRYGWPLERLHFQSDVWSMDFLTYTDDKWSDVVIAGEAKRLQREAVALQASLEVCGGIGDHEEGDCNQPRNHHKKYVGLLESRPRLLWIVGPGAFARAEPDLVFRVQVRNGGITRLRRVEARELQHRQPLKRERSRVKECGSVARRAHRRASRNLR